MRPDGRCGLEATPPPALTSGDPAQFQTSVDLLFRDYAPGTGRLRQLERLIAMAREDGVPVLVTLMPVLPGYLALVEREHAGAIAHYLRQAHGVRGADVLDWHDAGKLGLTFVDYSDYGHLADAAVPEMTARLGRELLARYPDLGKR